MDPVTAMISAAVGGYGLSEYFTKETYDLNILNEKIEDLLNKPTIADMNKINMLHESSSILLSNTDQLLKDYETLLKNVELDVSTSEKSKKEYESVSKDVNRVLNRRYKYAKTDNEIINVKVQQAKDASILNINYESEQLQNLENKIDNILKRESERQNQNKTVSSKYRTLAENQQRDVGVLYAYSHSHHYRYYRKKNDGKNSINSRLGEIHTGKELPFLMTYLALSNKVYPSVDRSKINLQNIRIPRSAEVRFQDMYETTSASSIKSQGTLLDNIPPSAGDEWVRRRKYADESAIGTENHYRNSQTFVDDVIESRNTDENMKELTKQRMYMQYMAFVIDHREKRNKARNKDSILYPSNKEIKETWSSLRDDVKYSINNTYSDDYYDVYMSAGWDLMVRDPYNGEEITLERRLPNNTIKIDRKKFEHKNKELDIPLSLRSLQKMDINDIIDTQKTNLQYTREYLLSNSFFLNDNAITNQLYTARTTEPNIVDYMSCPQGQPIYYIGARSYFDKRIYSVEDLLKHKYSSQYVQNNPDIINKRIQDRTSEKPNIKSETVASYRINVLYCPPTKPRYTYNETSRCFTADYVNAWQLGKRHFATDVGFDFPRFTIDRFTFILDTEDESSYLSDIILNQTFNIEYIRSKLSTQEKQNFDADIANVWIENKKQIDFTKLDSILDNMNDDFKMWYRNFKSKDIQSGEDPYKSKLLECYENLVALDSHLHKVFNVQMRYMLT